MDKVTEYQLPDDILAEVKDLLPQLREAERETSEANAYLEAARAKQNQVVTQINALYRVAAAQAGVPYKQEIQIRQDFTFTTVKKDNGSQNDSIES